jgi:hypothetical protein
MKKVFFYIIFIIFLNCCKSNVKKIDDNLFYDLSSEVLKSYKLNDVICFKSNLNNFDSIKIVEIDTLEIKDPSYSINKQAQEKIINVKIQYLSNSKTYEGFLQSKSGKYDSIGNQDFLSIHAIIENETNYYAYISYKEIISKLPLKKPIDTINNTNFNTKNPKQIKEIYWTKNMGLSGYKTIDNEIYTKQD